MVYHYKEVACELNIPIVSLPIHHCSFVITICNKHFCRH